MQQFAGTAGIADEDGKVAGALSLGVLFDGNLDTASRDKARKDVRYLARNGFRSRGIPFRT
jgi:hypothetical protein